MILTSAGDSAIAYSMLHIFLLYDLLFLSKTLNVYKHLLCELLLYRIYIYPVGFEFKTVK